MEPLYSVVKFLESAAKIAPLITACVAVCALIVGVKQLRIARENEAKRQFLNLFDEFIKNPLLSMAKFDAREEQDTISYYWLQTKMLQASESILELLYDDLEWREGIKDIIRNHIHYIDDKEMRFYSEKVRKIVRELKSEAAARKAP